MKIYKIGYFVGSLSEDSINRRLANTIVELAPDNLEFTEIVWSDYPVYNRDFDLDFPNNFPQPYLRGKEQIRQQDAILIVTPEHNRGVPGPLKNAIDALSRPWGDAPFTGKPVAVTGASPGNTGAAIAQSQWRTTLGFFDMPQMGQPEVYLKLDEDPDDTADVINSERTRAFIQTFVDAYASFVEQHAKALVLQEG